MTVRSKKPSALVPDIQKRVLYLATSLLWLSGALWMVTSQSSLQVGLMKLHGAVAMVFLMSFGTLVFEHVPPGWLQQEHRVSGGGLLGACALLAASGWGLYYIGAEAARPVLHWTHAILGLLLPVLIVLHVQVKRRTRGLPLEPVLKKGH